MVSFVDIFRVIFSLVCWFLFAFWFILYSTKSGLWLFGNVRLINGDKIMPVHLFRTTDRFLFCSLSLSLGLFHVFICRCAKQTHFCCVFFFRNWVTITFLRWCMVFFFAPQQWKLNLFVGTNTWAHCGLSYHKKGISTYSFPP